MKTTNWATFTLAKLRSAKRGAEARGIKWDLTESDIARVLARANGKCEVTQHPFVITGKVRREPWAPSLDRINSARGYTIDNVRLVCVIVNYALNEFGDSTFFEMIDAASSLAIRNNHITSVKTDVIDKIDETARKAAINNKLAIEKLEARISALEASGFEQNNAGVNVTQVMPISFSGATQMSTEDFARINQVKPQTVRAALCRLGHYNGVRPVKLASRKLVWPAIRAE